MAYEPELKELCMKVTFQYTMALSELETEMKRQNAGWQSGTMNGRHPETEEVFLSKQHKRNLRSF